MAANILLSVLLLTHMFEMETVLGFISSPIENISKRGYNAQRKNFNSRSPLEMSTKQHFNPFTQRQRNNKVKWFESDLDAFYSFVDNQPLLTAHEELQFGKALRMWSQVETMREQLEEEGRAEGNTAPVSDKQLANIIGCSVSTLEKMGPYADASKSKLINCNLRLVLAVVSRYRTAGIPNGELIAEGTRGLSKAVLRYDYSKGFRFSTYATWYVHQAIFEYVRWRKHPAKMPSRYIMLQRKVKEYSAEFKNENGRLPTVEELSINLIQKQYDIIKVLSMQTYPTLLGSPVGSANTKSDGSRNERTFEDLIPSVYKAPLAITDSKDLRRDMEQMMLVNLNEVERDVLRLRLGLDDGREKAVKEVGKRFKISWKQVRSVEKEALSKLLVSSEINEFVHNYNSV
jgi:RNA polymerase primary sigma factor